MDEDNGNLRSMLVGRDLIVDGSMLQHFIVTLASLDFPLSVHTLYEAPRGSNLKCTYAEDSSPFAPRRVRVGSNRATDLE